MLPTMTSLNGKFAIYSPLPLPLYLCLPVPSCLPIFILPFAFPNSDGYGEQTFSCHAFYVSCVLFTPICRGRLLYTEPFYGKTPVMYMC